VYLFHPSLSFVAEAQPRRQTGEEKRHFLTFLVDVRSNKMHYFIPKVSFYLFMKHSHQQPFRRHQPVRLSKIPVRYVNIIMSLNGQKYYRALCTYVYVEIKETHHELLVHSQ
jgi:hypothetical protein